MLRAIFISIGLSVLVVAVLVVSTLTFAAANSTTSPEFWKQFLSQLALQAMPAVLSIITVFYVTITYYLLKTTNELNKSQLKPFVRLQWKVGEKPERIATSSNQNFFQDSDGAKWLVLCIKNTREKTVEELNVKLAVTSSGPFAVKDYTVDYTALELDLGKDQTCDIGIANLSSVSNTGNISHSIESLTYSSAESSEALRTFSGRKSHTLQGLKGGN